MQKVQSNLKRSEEQIKLKDQEISRLKRKVLRCFLYSLLLSFHFHNDLRIATGQGVGDKEQESRNTTKEGTAAAAHASRSFGISLQKMFNARAKNLRDGG